MRRDFLSKNAGSDKTRSTNVNNPINTVSKQDAVCVVCGGALKPGAKKYCGFKCYRIIQRSVPLADRFWPKVNKRGERDCWLWTGHLFGSLGYGSLIMQRPDGKWVPQCAHRISWELTNGPIPDGQCVLHACDVPRCVNPAHLFLGTQRDNMQDAARKGRLSVPRPSRQKLTDAQVSQIRTARANGVRLMDLANEYGVSKTLVSLIAKGRRRQYDRPSGEAA